MAKVTPISVVDEMVALYTGNASQKRWFSRKMKNLPSATQDKVWSVLALMGHAKPSWASTLTPPAPEPAPVATPVEEVPAAEAAPRITVNWSEEEWNRLADLVWHGRRREPDETLVTLMRKAMEQLPADRRRNIVTLGQLKPLLVRLSALDAGYVEAKKDQARLAEVQARLTQAESRLAVVPSREEILSTVSDEEIAVFFGEKAVSLLAPDDVLKTYQPETLMSYVPFTEMVGHVIKTGIEMMGQRRDDMVSAIRDLAQARQPSAPAPAPLPNGGHKPAHSKPTTIPSAPPKATKPMRVTVVGLLADQANVVGAKLEGRAKFNFVDKNRMADIVPEGQDIVVLAANFISHGMQAQIKKKVAGTATRIILHHGGIDTMVKKLDASLPKLELV